MATPASNVKNATAIGAHSFVTQDNSLILGAVKGNNAATDDTLVGIGTTAPKAPLHVASLGTNVMVGPQGCFPGFGSIGFGATLACSNYSLAGDGTNTLINRPTGGSIFFNQNNFTEATLSTTGEFTVNNKIAVGTLGSAGSTQLCRNASNEISNCSSSLRYKKDIQAFSRGLSLLDQLNPIAFKWKADDSADLGFGAEDIAKVEPLLVTRNTKGEIEGVKYDRISAVLVNAVKEQQTQIEEQRQQIKALKQLVCLQNPLADLCKSEGGVK